jgi:hypothetical protein
MKVIIVTDKYASCDKCGDGAKLPKDPIIQIGSSLTGFVRLHRSCFDAVVTEVGEAFAFYVPSVIKHED